MNSYSYYRLKFLFLQDRPTDEDAFKKCIKSVKKQFPGVNISKSLLPYYEPPVIIKSGTSGYMFDWWFTKTASYQNFYPLGLSKTKLLEYYAAKLKSVELNSTFYKLPESLTIQKWYDITPKDFSFIIKMSKFATHDKKLIDFADNFKHFYNGRVDILKEKCEGILIQMPPTFKNTTIKSKVDGMAPLERIKKVGLDIKDMDIPQLFIEFRDITWFNDQEVIKVLKEIGWSMVFVMTQSDDIIKGGTSGIYPPLKSDNITVENIAYFRFHGTSREQAYQGLYTNNYLTNLKLQVAEMNIQKQYYMFNNTDSLSKISGVSGISTTANVAPDAIINALFI